MVIDLGCMSPVSKQQNPLIPRIAVDVEEGMIGNGPAFFSSL
jgi:hypothetical protein